MVVMVIFAMVVMVAKAMIMIMMIKIRMIIEKGGFSIFYPDDGLDTGDLLLTRCSFNIIIFIISCSSLSSLLSSDHRHDYCYLHNLFLLRECNVSVNDTVDSLYNNFMYPEGVKAMGEAVQVHDDHLHNNDFNCND